MEQTILHCSKFLLLKNAGICAKSAHWEHPLQKIGGPHDKDGLRSEKKERGITQTEQT